MKVESSNEAILLCRHTGAKRTIPEYAECWPSACPACVKSQQASVNTTDRNDPAATRDLLWW